MIYDYALNKAAVLLEQTSKYHIDMEHLSCSTSLAPIHSFFYLQIKPELIKMPQFSQVELAKVCVAVYQYFADLLALVVKNSNFITRIVFF